MTKTKEPCKRCKQTGISYTSLGDGCNFRDIDCAHCKGTGFGECQIDCHLCSLPDDYGVTWLAEYERKRARKTLGLIDEEA